LEKDAIEIMETDNILHPDNADDLDIKIDILKEAINGLDNDQKKCIDFFYLQDKSYAEVVEITGYTMNQVKSFIQNGKRNLKIYITEMYEKRIE
jgi:RNA polymerase sigma-70 factor (ECF subfamily)